MEIRDFMDEGGLFLLEMAFLGEYVYVANLYRRGLYGENSLEVHKVTVWRFKTSFIPVF